MLTDYIIIQAGGKGTRLKALTVNKPKAIVSVDNLPIIYHLFRKFPDKKFIIIGDYLKNVLEKYLESFPEVECIVVGTDGNTGTCSGMGAALSIIPPKTRFMIIWSDLILGENFKMPDDEKEYIGISESFECRWSYVDKQFVENKSTSDGVAGLFIFNDKSAISDVPKSGEFVKWLQFKQYNFERLGLGGTAEYGLLEKIKPQESGKCRPFNAMKEIEGKLVKIGIDDQGRKLAIREKNWYNHVKDMGISIPKIYSLEPFTMELIPGKNVFEYVLTIDEKRAILQKIIQGLEALHEHDKSYPDLFSIKKAYFDKTIDRISKVRNLIPLANQEIIVVNGKRCRNVFFHIDELREKILNIPVGEFCLIHGDCTFSNIMLRNGLDPIFIDPRGYFGNCELIGDPNYDWAKLYYSLYGDYDQFNLGRFTLTINGENVHLEIKSNEWRCLETDFIKMLPKNVDINTIRLIHAIIWLSLTTYAWNDYDSICGSFYNGLYYLEDVL